MPVELMLLPKGFYFNIYAISYWSRAVLIPLLIIFAHRPVCQIPREQGIDELYLTPRKEIRYWKFPPFNKDQKWFTPHNFFVALDGMLKLYDRMPLSWLREKALHRGCDLDAGTHQGQWWAGGDLSGHGEFDRGPSLPRLSGRRSIGAEGAPRNRIAGSLRHGVDRRSARRGAASSALPLSNLGYGIAHERLYRNRDAAGPPIPPESGVRTWSLAKRKRLEIGSFRLPMRNREAGTSSLRTSSIPMWMTRQWC